MTYQEEEYWGSAAPQEPQTSAYTHSSINKHDASAPIQNDIPKSILEYYLQIESVSVSCVVLIESGVV